MCPAPPGSVNSLSLDPHLAEHALIGSNPPAGRRCAGCRPPVWFFGIVSVPAGTLFAPHDVVTLTVN